MLSLGIDIGGTFTDVILIDDSGRTLTSKQLTTDDDLTRCCIVGVEDVINRSSEITTDAIERTIHATTQATNAILAERTPPVAFLGTSGFEHMFEFWRLGDKRRDNFNLLWDPESPPVDHNLAYGVPERIRADGTVVQPIDEAAVRRIVEELGDKGVVGVAICLLHGYRHPKHEQEVESIIRQALPEMYVVRSSQVWPIQGEYDRGLVSVLTAMVGPVMVGYLTRLQEEMTRIGVRTPIYVMQSNGGLVDASDIAAQPLASIESGPVAGTLGAAYFGREAGFDNLLALDMGGTTAKAAVIIDGQPLVREDFTLGGSISGGKSGLTVRMPVIDLVEVGAGGGSIAYVDAGGVLQVGPRSAGASPGPACYGFGGVQPTVTDANLVLGYLSEDSFLGGRLRLNRSLSEEAIREHVAARLGLSLPEAASAIHQVANVRMASAIDLVTIERGIDPRELTAVGFGGAGPSHIAELAQHFDIDTVLIPRLPGLFSTLGMLAADVVYEKAVSQYVFQNDLTPETLCNIFEQLEYEAIEAAHKAGAHSVHVLRSVDARYPDQFWELKIPITANLDTREAVDNIASDFHNTYLSRYGVTRDDPVMCQTFRSRVIGGMAGIKFGPPSDHGSDVSSILKGTRPLYMAENHEYQTANVYRRDLLTQGMRLDSPAVIEEEASTTIIPLSWTAEVDSVGNLILRRATHGAAEVV